MAATATTQIGWVSTNQSNPNKLFTDDFQYGLGSMGLAMASNLQRHLRAKNSLNLIFSNRTMSRGDSLRELGGVPETSFEKVVEKCGIIFTMVCPSPNSPYGIHVDGCVCVCRSPTTPSSPTSFPQSPPRENPSGRRSSSTARPCILTRWRPPSPSSKPTRHPSSPRPSSAKTPSRRRESSCSRWRARISLRGTRSSP